MAMSAGSSNTGLSNEPNVTPMIDVLLVLLIIFMLVVPMARKAIDINLPDPTPQPATVTKSDQIVLEVCKNNVWSINKQPVDPTPQALAAKIKEIYDPRPEKIIFVKGCPEAKYQDVITAMDIARGGGVKVIGVPPKDAK
ncbi:MAG TPA: biopolymer transporter ExbD [Gemmatimonadaceae bacterium]|nr:biopolymer transporter ExbD [Gemmatimonadaceae bacterium]